MNRTIIENKKYSLIDIFTWCNSDCKIELSEDVVKIKKSRDLVEKLSLSDDSIYELILDLVNLVKFLFKNQIYINYKKIYFYLMLLD